MEHKKKIAFLERRIEDRTEATDATREVELPAVIGQKIEAPLSANPSVMPAHSAKNERPIQPELQPTHR